jgi:hypothetical protein
MSDSVTKWHEIQESMPEKSKNTIAKSTGDILQELSLYAKLNYKDDWYLEEKINQLKSKIYE